MDVTTDRIAKLPPEQQAIRDRCFHPSGTFVEFPTEDVETSISARFEKIVRMYPERIAIETDNESLTYDALNRAANRLVNLILVNGDIGEMPVAVILPRCISQAVALIAILKTGKPFLQLDPQSSDDELAHVLADVETRLIVTNKNTELRLRGLLNHSVQVIDIDAANDGGINPCISIRTSRQRWQHTGCREAERRRGRYEIAITLATIDIDQNPIVQVTSESGAYIKYTSGSTKRAKGVAVSHRSILHSVLSYTNSSHFCLEDRSLIVIGNYVNRPFFVHLLNGATLCSFDFGSEGLHRLAAWMERHKITIYRSFPGAFRLFVSSLSGMEQFSNLRIISLGGEPMYRSDLELFKKTFSRDCILIHSYASSETRMICSYYLDHETEIIGHRVPVGYPEHGKEVAVVDDQGNDVPIGQSGEIVVKSRFLSSGYWRRSEESELSFRSSKASPETKVYRTGDLGRLSTDGCLTHLGRMDDRIKIRNFRVDVGEVEARLAEHPAVKLVAVTAREDVSGDLRLLAYYVARTQPAPTVTELREFLGATLPPYMVPAVFVELPEMPITSTGKVNRRALPDPAKTRPHLATLFVEARTPIERTLSQVWADVLRLASIGIHDDFLELGGHSLAATRIISQVVKEFQLELPVTTLFQSPTIAAMSAVIAEHQSKNLADTEFDRILLQLESLSDEEAERILALTTGKRVSADGK